MLFAANNFALKFASGIFIIWALENKLIKIKRIKLKEQLKQQKLEELKRLNGEKKKNKDLEDKIEKNKKIIENQEEEINKNDAILEDKIERTKENNMRINMGVHGLRKVFNKMAIDEGLTLQEWTKKHGSTYSPQDGFKVLEDAFKQLPPITKDISRDKELTR